MQMRARMEAFEEQMSDPGVQAQMAQMQAVMQNPQIMQRMAELRVTPSLPSVHVAVPTWHADPCAGSCADLVRDW